MENKNNISQELFESIERYLENTMIAEERLEFETKLNDDPVFRELVNETKLLALSIESASLKTKLESFHNELAPASSNEDLSKRQPFYNKKSGVYKILIAASLITFGVFYFINQTNSPKRLFAKHFTPDPGLPTTMSSTSNYLFFEGMVDYKMDDYSTAISKWNELIAIKPNNDTLNYFVGVAQLAAKNEEEAIIFLQKAITDQESVFIQDAYYYLGLAYLKDGDIESSRKYLKLSNTENSKQILNDLK